MNLRTPQTYLSFRKAQLRHLAIICQYANQLDRKGYVQLEKKFNKAYFGQQKKVV